MWKTFHKFKVVSNIKWSTVFSNSVKKAKVALIKSGEFIKSQVSYEFDLSYNVVAKQLSKYGEIDIPDRNVIHMDNEYAMFVKVQTALENIVILARKQQIKID